MEEIRHITWDLDGVELSHEQSIQRIILGGFPIQGGVALTMFCIVEGESGEYQRAWHINCERNTDGTIRRYDANGEEHMRVKSIDLGFMQFNVNVTDQLVQMEDAMVMEFVEAQFDANPDLADPFLSAQRAYELYKIRGFQPWYAYKPGTAAWRMKKKYGAKAFANWLVHSYVGKDPETGKRLNMDYV